MSTSIRTIRTLSALHLLAGLGMTGLGIYAAVASYQETTSSTSAVGLVIGAGLAALGLGLAGFALVGVVTGGPTWALVAGVIGLTCALSAMTVVPGLALVGVVLGGVLSFALVASSIRALRLPAGQSS